MASRFLFGSMARGEGHAGSDIDLLVVADPRRLSFADLARALAKPQQTLAREVNPTVYAPGDFQRKLAGGHHFLRSVMAADKVFIIGGEDELQAMARVP